MAEPDVSDAPHAEVPGALPDLTTLVGTVEDVLLGGPRRYTRYDVAERAGVRPDDATSLWRALGFASVEDDERAFTDGDLAAISRVQQLQSVGDIDDDLMLAMTRIIGQSFARLASWQAQLVVEIISRRPDLLDDGGRGAEERLAELVGTLTPAVGELHDYVWRRQLAAVLARMASNSGAEGGATSSMVVGFVDMAGFTTLTRNSSEAELRTVLTAFETLATDVVAARRGQIVKTIGDEILFVADDPAAAADIALTLVESADADAVLPQVRGGLAYGPVVSRLGDVFGQTVNIASRLTKLARTDSVLIDEGLAAVLASDSRFELRSLRPASVRGYHHLKSWRLRRAQG